MDRSQTQAGTCTTRPVRWRSELLGLIEEVIGARKLADKESKSI